MSRSLQGAKCSIIPPYLLREIVRCGTGAQKECALQTLIQTEHLRGLRIAGLDVSAVRKSFRDKNRSVYDAGHKSTLPGKLVRGEGEAKSKDRAVNEAYETSGAYYDFLKKVYKRNSLNDKGFPLRSSVHYGRKYDNAFWNGSQMVYGDGDGHFFKSFVRSIDVIGHELTHGMVQFEANLAYEGQPGALNESFADVFGSVFKQYQKRQKTDEADWLIGDNLFTPKVRGRALRSLKAPGTAYNDPVLGKDPQPAHMKNYVKTHEDNGGVHINSGIPNKAFYEAAVRIGGYAWERAGRIWYMALKDILKAESNFHNAAKATFTVAGKLFNKDSPEQRSVKQAWRAVGISL